jgi:hypothetical protein
MLIAMRLAECTSLPIPEMKLCPLCLGLEPPLDVHLGLLMHRSAVGGEEVVYCFHLALRSTVDLVLFNDFLDESITLRFGQGISTSTMIRTRAIT